MPPIDRVRQIFEWMQRNKRRLGPLRVADICDGLGICYQTFHRVLSEHSLTLWMMRKALVLDHCQAALESNPNANPDVVARQIGFTSGETLKMYLWRAGNSWAGMQERHMRLTAA